MPLPRRKRKPLPEVEEEPIDLDQDQLNTLDMLVKGGFDYFWAGRLAVIPQLDWHLAVRLRKQGCTQELVEEILR